MSGLGSRCAIAEGFRSIGEVVGVEYRATMQVVARKPGETNGRVEKNRATANALIGAVGSILGVSDGINDY